MSQRDSGYERVKNDAYQTPPWVTEALLPHLPPDLRVWECACGTGQMLKVLQQNYDTHGTDIAKRPSVDFLLKDQKHFDHSNANAIITNPPYTFAEEFITHALWLTEKQRGLCAFLLRTDYDHAASRKYLFADNKAFAKKIVLTKRIQWFEHSTSAPSFNHCWMLWDHHHKGPPVIAYGP